MTVIYPDGAKRHVWFKEGELPRVVSDEDSDSFKSPQSNSNTSPPNGGSPDLSASTSSSDGGGLPDFDDEDSFGATDDGDQSKDGDGSEDSF